MIPRISFLCITTLITLTLSLPQQIPFDSSTSLLRSLSDETTWNSLGPFPIGTREYPLLPPFLPSLNTSSISYYSPLIDDASISWSTITEDEQGFIKVGEFDRVRWNELRHTAGWSVLQYRNHYVRFISIEKTGLYEINLEGGATEFSILQRGQKEDERTSYNANVYSYSLSRGHLISFVQGEEYELRVDYVHDIRVRGEPENEQSIPIGRWRLSIQKVEEQVVVGEGRTTVPDWFNGWAMGSFVGVEVTNRRDVAVTLESVVGDHREIKLSIQEPITIAPHQTRLVAIHLDQSAPIHPSSKSSKTISLDLKLKFTDSSSLSTTLSFPLISDSSSLIKSVYLSNTLAPTYTIYKTPFRPETCSPITFLALHGAGVDPSTADEWTSSIKRRQEEWIVMPLGLSEWGYDWHGPSLKDEFEAIANLDRFLRKRYLIALSGNQVEGIEGCRMEKLVVLGHSNGGQGAWYFMGRYPDLVLGGVPAAAYVKIQDYVPYSHSLGHHYRDPSLTGILMSSLTPFDNDLYASNLVQTPLLVRHGGIDDNVPVQNSRQLVTIIKEWSSSANVTMSEVPGRLHWFDEVFREEPVQAWVDRLVEGYKIDKGNKEKKRRNSEFTVRTANPDESGPLNGFRIWQLETPGRLAEIQVKVFDKEETESRIERIEIRTKNVLRFEIEEKALNQRTEIMINDQRHLTTCLQGDGLLIIDLTDTGSSRPLLDNSSLAPVRRYGPLISILTTPHPLIIVVGTSANASNTEHLRSIANRIAADAYLYGRIDSIIIEDRKFSKKLEGNVVLVGDSFSNHVTKEWEKEWPVPVNFLAPSAFKIHSRTFQSASTAFIFLLPRPSSPSSLVIVLAGTDDRGLEKAYRLFPFRTGVALPEWAVSSGSEAGQKGGIEAAGFWNNEWGWSERMSFI